MATPVLIDTHIWIWWLLGQPELSQREHDALDAMAANGTPPGLSAISLWEAQMLVAKQRLQLAMPLSQWLTSASAPECVTIFPLDVPVVLALDKLPKKFHGDPADRIIAATARAHSLPLATRDVNIRKSRVVKIWKT